MAPGSELFSSSVIAGLLLLAGTVLQAANGSVSGQLTDPQGRPVRGAKVSALPVRDSRTQETRSDSDGRFAFSSLPVGGYKLVGAASGFVDVGHRGCTWLPLRPRRRLCATTSRNSL